MKKIPMRTCVVSREKLPKNELIRVVKTDDGVIVDLTGKVNGHGVYLKRDKEVFDKAEKTKILNKLLETTVEESVFEELRKTI
jgi:hypothetical protein